MLHWHAQITSITLRAYEREPEASFAAREPFVAVAQVEFLGDKRAFVHAFLRVDGCRIGHRDWLALQVFMQRYFGIEHLDSDRHGEDKTYDTAPAPLD